MNIGQRIKEKRKQLKISADELGKRLGKNRSTIFRYESGEIENLPLDVLKPIADALQTTPEYLMGWTKEEIVFQANEEMADLYFQMRKNEKLAEVIKILCKLPAERLDAVLLFLKALE